MIPQIKQRLNQIQCGEVPEGYKKTKVGIVPDDWEETRFKRMFSRLSRKNKENNDNVLTISAQYGFISQRDFFNKDIAS
jgi:type I restriction enzyme S subunit